MDLAEKMPLAGKLKLVVVDLDGTILGGHVPYVRIPDHVAAFLDSLEDVGCKWAISTTWDPDGQWNLVRSSAVKSHPTYFMGEYGNQLATYSDEGAVPVEEYNSLMREKLDVWCAEYFYPAFRKLIARFDPRKVLFYGHALTYVFKENDRDEVWRFAEEELADDAIEAGLGASNLNIRPSYLHKGLGLQEVVNRENLSPEQVAIAGDGIIDIPMMQPGLASYYVAPANSQDPVKEWVRSNNGVVSDLDYGAGVIDGLLKISD